MIYNSRDLFYKTPFGAVCEGEVITFRLTLPLQTAHPVVHLFKSNHTVPQLSSVFALVQQNKETNECVYEAKLTAPCANLYYYHFILERHQFVRRGAKGIGDINSHEGFQLTVTSKEFATPEQFHGKIFYQIFPDRFHNSGKTKVNVPADRFLHPSWDCEPVGVPDSDGGFWCNDYFGGDLAGIEAKLDYIHSLGVEAIYLNPVFEAHANHRYNTADYMAIDPLLGTEADFISLCDAAHAMGIKIVLDGVFNHTGSDSVYFNKEKRYPLVGAVNDANSHYKDWFIWQKYPHIYESWWGFDTLPNVNENSPDYRAFICGKGGVIDHWINAGADGFRLDVADELPDDFIEDIRVAVKRANPQALLLGEVWEDASNKQAYGVERRYFQGTELDSVMNYPWRKAIMDFIRYGKGEALEDSIMTILENYPKPCIDTALNNLSTHDIPRAITYLGGEPMENNSREWQRLHNTLTPEQYFCGRHSFLLASVIQYALAGCPCLYYGDEAGLVGYADPFNRGTYPWAKKDETLVAFFQLLGTIRKNSEVLRMGDFTPLVFSHDLCMFTRSYGDKTVLVAVNRSGEPVSLADHIPLEAKTLITVGVLTEPYTLEKNSAIMMEYPMMTEHPVI